MINVNLQRLRCASGYSQEYVAEQIGVSRQAVAKWEAGETVPDLGNASALAELYQVKLDDLVHHDESRAGYPVPPKGKHIFGTVKVGDRGQIVIPKQARDLFGIRCGDNLLILGDEEQGIALVKAEEFLSAIQTAIKGGGSR